MHGSSFKKIRIKTIIWEKRNRLERLQAEGEDSMGGETLITQNVEM